MFLVFNRETRTDEAAAAYDFLKTQSEEAGRIVLELEQRLAEFKVKYGDAVPDERGRSLLASDRAEGDLDNLERQILLANERETMLELQLSQINPNLFDPAGDWRMELTELRAELAAARQRYTEDHPDIRRLIRSIDALSARADLSTSNVVPDNPAYIQLANQLDTVKRELAVLRANAARAREQIASYARVFEMAPDVERQYRELIRDYEGAQERLRGIETRLNEAALGQELESEQRGGRLTLISAPRRPYSPDSPNRLGILLLGVVLGGGLAVGLAALVESSDPTIRSARDLREITDIKAIGAIPIMLNNADARNRLVAWGTASLILVVAVILVGSRVAGASVL
jgi:uncharacterized protein involved in exopolysaccharide biosynthesis